MDAGRLTAMRIAQGFTCRRYVKKLSIEIGDGALGLGTPITAGHKSVAYPTNGKVWTGLLPNI